MTPFTWRQVGNAPSSVDPIYDQTVNQNFPGTPQFNLTSTGGAANGYTLDRGVWQAWAGGCWHETIGRLRVFCGGHGDSGDNTVYEQLWFSLTPNWRRATWPTGSRARPSVTGHLDDGQEDENRYFDFVPRSAHTYNLLTPRGDEMWFLQPGAPWRSGSGKRLGLAVFDHRGWRRVWQGSVGVTGVSTRCLVYSRLTDRVYTFPQSGSCQYFDCTNPAAGPTTVAAMYHNIGAFAWHALHLPELNAFMNLANEFTGGFSVNTGEGAFSQPGVVGGVATPTWAGYDNPYGYPNAVWVPWYGARGTVMHWHGGTTIHTLTPPPSGSITSQQWTRGTITAHASNTVDPGNPPSSGVHNKMFASRRLGGIGITKSAEQSSYFFALE